MYLGVCQTPVLTSLEGVREFLDAAVAEMPSPGIVLFPELLYGGFDYGRVEMWLERTPEVMRMFQECATAHRIALAATFLESGSAGPLNSLYFFEPGQAAASSGGGLCGHRIYSKVHLFPSGEHLHFQPGSPVFQPVCWQGLTIAGCICYDLRFPEIFRSQTFVDPDVFLVAGQWPALRIAHWQTLLPARAVENQCYVLACNGSGASALGPLGGRSCLTDPQGERIFQLGSEVGCACAPYDPAAVRDARVLISTRTSPVLGVLPRP